MRKIKKINGYLVVKFNDRELREWEGTGLGTYGVIDAELYTGTLEVAIEQARGLASELDAEEPAVTVTVVKETNETTEEDVVDPWHLLDIEKDSLELRILGIGENRLSVVEANSELRGFETALVLLGLISPHACSFHRITFEVNTDSLPRETFENIPPELKKDRDARRLYSLGLALEGDCPQNDCTLYRNVFRMARELDSALNILEGHAAAVVERELLKNHRELREMYLFNHAIQSYKEAMQP